MASRAQQLLEHSLLSELHAVVARALSGLDMFAGNQLSESDLYGSYGLDDADNLSQKASILAPTSSLYLDAPALPSLLSSPGLRAE